MIIPTPAVLLPPSEDVELRKAESSLLNRRLPMGSGLRIWNRQAKQWEGYRPATTRLTMVNLWSVDCPPCIAEMPTLDAMARQFTKEYAGYSSLIVSETTDERELFLSIHKYKLFTNQENILIYTGSALRDTLGTNKKPITVLIDRDAVIRQAFVGSIINRRGELAESVAKLSEVAK